MRIPAARMVVAVTAGVAMLITAACGSSGPSGAKTSAGGGKKSGVHLTLLIGSSGDAETNAVNAAAKAWSAKSGNTVTVTPAKDLTQELTQALAGGSPPDLFYVDASKFAGLVKANALALTVTNWQTRRTSIRRWSSPSPPTASSTARPRTSRRSRSRSTPTCGRRPG